MSIVQNGKWNSVGTSTAEGAPDGGYELWTVGSPQGQGWLIRLAGIVGNRWSVHSRITPGYQVESIHGSRKQRLRMESSTPRNDPQE